MRIHITSPSTSASYENISPLDTGYTLDMKMNTAFEGITSDQRVNHGPHVASKISGNDTRNRAERGKQVSNAWPALKALIPVIIFNFFQKMGPFLLGFPAKLSPI